MLRTLPVDAGPLGLVSAGQPDPVMIWAEDGGRRVLTYKQETDDDGAPLWTCYLMPSAAEKPEVVQLRVPAKVQPGLTLFGPVDVVGLDVNARVDKAGKLAQYWSAAEARDAARAPAAMASPSPSRPPRARRDRPDQPEGGPGA